MKTCFVVMPIGEIPDVITESDLKKRYDDLIREALLKAAPGLEVTRADEVTAPGTINNDIITRLMHSDLVVVDITFPNPNVFYELGLRHAARAGTILLKEKDGKYAPFDVSSLRHIPYENSPTGLKKLAEELGKQIAWIERNPGKPDSAFLELAHLVKYRYPNTAEVSADAIGQQTELFMRLFANPKIAAIMEKQRAGTQMSMGDMREMMDADPETARLMISLLLQQKLIGLRDT